jgi:hypothetical protein
MTKTGSIFAWCLAQTGAVVLTLLVFCVWAPWVGAHSYSEAIALYGNVVPKGCDAVTVNHGHFSCMAWGTVASNPWGFALCTLGLFPGLAFLVFTRLKGKGIFSTAGVESAREKINLVCSRVGCPEIPARHVQRLFSFALFGVALVVLFSIGIFL